MLKAHVIEITKSCIATFRKARKSLVERGKKQKTVEMFFFFEALAKTFLLTWKYCSWLTFYQMDFMKR